MPMWGLVGSAGFVALIAIAILVGYQPTQTPAASGPRPAPTFTLEPEAPPAAPLDFTVGSLDFTPTTDTVGDLRGTLNGQRVRLLWNPEAETVGIAIWSHGQDGDVDSRVDTPWFRNIIEDGWAVASSDLHGRNWGSAAAIQDLADLHAWSQQRIPADRTMFVAGSMGGLSTLNAMRLGAVPAHCWYGTMPVVDIDAAAVTVPSAKAQIPAAHGVGGVPDELRIPLNVPPLPEALYHARSSPEDTIVPQAQNTAVLAQLLGDRLTQSAAVGEHGDVSHFDAADLAAFADRCEVQG